MAPVGPPSLVAPVTVPVVRGHGGPVRKSTAGRLRSIIPYTASVEPDAAAWAALTSRLVAESHLVAGDGLSAMFDEALRTVGLRGEVLLVDMG